MKSNILTRLLCFIGFHHWGEPKRYRMDVHGDGIQEWYQTECSKCPGFQFTCFGGQTRNLWLAQTTMADYRASGREWK